MKMPDNDKPNGWNEWSRHVLKELERLNECYEDLAKEFHEYRIKSAENFATLKVKAGLWGALAGAVPVALGMLYALSKTH